MACRSFNSPIARARFCVSARVIDPRRSQADPSCPFPIRLSFFLSLSQILRDRYPRIVSARSVIYGFGSCSHRGGVMTGRSAPGYHLYRFPLPGPCLLYVATFDITIPRECLARQRSILGQAILTGFEFWETIRWRTCCRRPWRFCLNPIDSRRYFETDCEMYCPEIFPSIFVCSKNI